jgi:hypothetical protein
MSHKLFEDDENENTNQLTVNLDYAEKFEAKKKKEELSKRIILNNFIYILFHCLLFKNFIKHLCYFI